MFAILPYNMGSASATALRDALREREHRAIKVYPDRNYRPRGFHTIINWGHCSNPRWMAQVRATGARLINSPVSCNRVADKAAFFLRYEDALMLPQAFYDQREARYYLRSNPRGKVYCRTLTRANSGRGIVVANEPEELVPAPLYTTGVPCTHEYRLHVFNGRVIKVQQKRTRRRLEEGQEINRDIRNLDGGWIFASNAIEFPGDARRVVEEAVLPAVTVPGLTFGAVDVVYDLRSNRAWVLEVNTAPGLEGSTLDIYADTIAQQRRG